MEMGKYDRELKSKNQHFIKKDIMDILITEYSLYLLY